MNALVVFSAVLAVSQASLLGLPYGAALSYGAGLPYGAGYGAGLPYGAGLVNTGLHKTAGLYGGARAYGGYGYGGHGYGFKPAPAAPLSTQYQSQDEYGNINYGYSNINSAKVEVGNAYGGVTGSYSYVDAYGVPQRVDYIADGLGFRAKATNLPVPPALPAAPLLAGPAPVADTPEVVAAKAEFQAAYDEAASRHKRSLGYGAPALSYAAAPYALSYAAAPYAASYAAPYAASYAAPYSASYAAPYAASYAAPAAYGAGYPYAQFISRGSYSPRGIYEVEHGVRPH